MPSTRVGARDLGDIALYWRAQGRPDLAKAFATDPRRGRRARDGLRFPNLDRDSSCNFRPVLLAGLGDWRGLVDWCDSYYAEGWQLREWNSPTYTARVLAALCVGAAQATGIERRRLREAVHCWAQLLALMSAVAPRLPLSALYGDAPIEVPDTRRFRRGRPWFAIAPAGMQANRWTALQHGADAVLHVLIDPMAAARIRGEDMHKQRRRPMPEDPAAHRRPVPGRSAAVVSAAVSGRPLLQQPMKNLIAGCIRGEEEEAAIRIARNIERSRLRTWRHLRVRIQRRGPTVLAALSRATSSQKGAVTAARLSPAGLAIQAVSPPRPRSPQPRVEWTDEGVEAVARDGSVRSTIPWLDDPWVDLTISRHGVTLASGWTAGPARR